MSGTGVPLMSLERYLEAAGRKNTQRRRTCRLLATITRRNQPETPAVSPICPA